MPRSAKLGVSILLVAVGLAVTLVTVAGAPGGEIDKALAPLADGGVLHRVVEVYQRQGVVAERVREYGGVGALPERYTRETWALLGADGEVQGLIGIIRSEDGGLIQRSRLEGSVITTANLWTQESSTRAAVSTAIQTRQPELLAQSARDFYEAGVSSGRLTVASSDEEEIVYISVRPVPQDFVSLEASDDFFRVPYYDDLRPVQIETEYILRSDHAPIRTLSWAILDSGRRVLLESKDYKLIESLPSSSWDEIVDQAGYDQASRQGG